MPDVFGPKKPLFGPYTYRAKQNSNGDTLIAVYHGSKRVAHIDAYWAYSMRAVEEHEAEEVQRVGGRGRRLVCATDLRALGAEGRYPNVLRVGHAFVDDEAYKGKGIGRAMYEAMMAEGFAVRQTRVGGQPGPMFLIPDECGGAGNTSADAKRVWASLARDYPSRGTSIRVDAPPVIGSRVKANPRRRKSATYPRVVVALDQHLPQATAWVEAGFYFEEGGCIGMALALQDTLRRYGVTAPLALFPGSFKHAGVLVGKRFLDASGLGLQDVAAAPVTRHRLLEVAEEWGNTAEGVLSDQEYAQRAIDVALEEEPVANPRRRNSLRSRTHPSAPLNAGARGIVSYRPDPTASTEGEWDRTGLEPVWHQSHDALVLDALHSWKGDPVEMNIHIADERGNAPLPASGSGKQKRAQAAALIYEMTHNNTVSRKPLFRGSHETPRGEQSWTTSRKIAERWAAKNNGQVFDLPAGTRGLRIEDYFYDTMNEKEWIIHTPPNLDYPMPMHSRMTRTNSRRRNSANTREEDENVPDCAWCGAACDQPHPYPNRRGEMFCSPSHRSASNRALARFLGAHEGPSPRRRRHGR